MQEFYYRLGYGMVGEGTFPQPVLGPRTINFYVDQEGYLVNYPGKTDLFRRDQAAHVGAPPALDPGTPITRIQAFTDVWGVDHIVYVRGASLCEMYGNGVRTLYTFVGRKVLGKFFPDLFVFQSKLIITNFGDPVLMWDGLKAVQPLGIHEAPLPPDVRSGQAPFTSDPGHATNPFFNQGYGPYKYKGYWWPGQTPSNGPGDNLQVDNVTPASGVYQLVAQFMDEYGNKGPVSAPSNPISIQSNTATTAPGDDYSDSPLVYNPEFLTWDSTPPQSERHAVGLIVGSTLSLNQNGGAGSEDSYFVCHEQSAPYPTRGVQQLADYQLAAAEAIDLAVSGPPSCGQGATWGQRICLWDLEDPFRFLWSDSVMFGQFRSTNEYRGQDKARAAVPVGDRVLLVSSTSVEILYDNSGVMTRLEQQFSFGSNHGRSLLDVGGAVFGLWTRGWGFYDGDQFVPVPAPYFLQGSYVDNQFYVMQACLFQRSYLLSVRLNAETEGPTHLIKFDLDTRQWFLLDEQVWDMTVWKGTLLGCATSIYELFKGQFAASTLELFKLTAGKDNVLQQRSINNIELFLEPGSAAEATCVVSGSFLTDPVETVEGLVLQPALSSASKNKYKTPYWNTKYLYADLPLWAAPGSMVLTVNTKTPVTAVAHTLLFEFPAAHPIRLQGLGITWSDDQRGYPQ